MNELLAGIYGLLSALSWGSGDFTGGLASKRTSAFTVVVISQFFGALLILALAFISAEPFPGWRDMAWGAIAGGAGALGLLVFYQALSAGKMGLVAPLTSVISAIVPVIVGFALEGYPAPIQLIGILVALGSVWLVSQPEPGRLRWRALFDRSFWQAPLVAGFGFGLFFLFIGLVTPGAVYWPLIGARTISLSLLFLTGFALGRLDRPESRRLPVIILAGFLDVGGNVFFVLAAQTGRLDISAVLSSFFSAVTVFWAWVILREKLSVGQLLGVAGVVLSVVLITNN